MKLTLLGQSTEALTITTKTGHENVPAEQPGPRFPSRLPLELKGTGSRTSHKGAPRNKSCLTSGA